MVLGTPRPVTLCLRWSFTRSNYEPSARRPSLSGGAPTWAPKEPSETDKSGEASGSLPHVAVASVGGPLANAVSGMPGPAMVVSAPETKEAIKEGSGLDSLGATATLDQTQLGPRGHLEVAKLEGRTSLATVKVKECCDGDLGCRRSDPRSGRLSAAGAKRVGELLTALARELGGWLESASRGDLADDENGGEPKGKCGGGGGLVTHVPAETQTEDDIQAIVKEGTESKLLPWAKPWSPTQGPGKIVDYSSPRANEEEKKVKSTSNLVECPFNGQSLLWLGLIGDR